MTIPRHLIGWVGGTVSTLLAVGLILNQLTFDSELLAAETRIMTLVDTSDRRIIEQLLDTQRLLIGQQQQQYLTLRRELIDQQLSVMREQYQRSPKEEKGILQERVSALQRKLEEVDRQLQSLLLKPKNIEPDKDGMF